MDIIYLLIGALSVLVIYPLILWMSKGSAILKDQMIPQMPPSEQTYSLARTQMAFWFLLILFAFIYIYIDNIHLNTIPLNSIITSQALVLMGISGLTAGGAAMVDAAQDTPEDAVSDGLKARGLSNYQDVLDTKRDIKNLEATNPLTPAIVATLNDKKLLIHTFETKTAGFRTQGFWKDLTTDIDGTALHRLQALVWTVVLGIVFVSEVCQHQHLPDFGEYLLALMGISNAGYVGFKYNETQY